MLNCALHKAAIAELLAKIEALSPAEKAEFFSMLTCQVVPTERGRIMNKVRKRDIVLHLPHPGWKKLVRRNQPTDQLRNYIMQVYETTKPLHFQL
jgi:hypothetical protein